jgi:hypothetical protein
MKYSNPPLIYSEGKDESAVWRQKNLLNTHHDSQQLVKMIRAIIN